MTRNALQNGPDRQWVLICRRTGRACGGETIGGRVSAQVRWRGGRKYMELQRRRLPLYRCPKQLASRRGGGETIMSGAAGGGGLQSCWLRLHRLLSISSHARSILIRNSSLGEEAGLQILQLYPWRLPARYRGPGLQPSGKGRRDRRVRSLRGGTLLPPAWC